MSYIERAYSKSVKTCDRCGGTGKISRSGIVGQCVCNLVYKGYLKFAEAGIPELYWEKKITDYTAPDKDSLRTIMNYIDRLKEMYRRGIGLYFWGGFGVGKTGLIVEILKSAILAEFNCKFLFFPETIHALTSFDTVSSEKRERVESELVNSDILVLDDIGREYRRMGSNWVGSNIDAYFRSRVNAGLPTLMTSNFSFGKIEELYGSSIASIFRGSLVDVEVRGSDFREVEGNRKARFLED
jgi:DNA replication protein DnaC